MAECIKCVRKSDGQPCRARLMEGSFRVRDLETGMVAEGEAGDFLLIPTYGARYVVPQARFVEEYEGFTLSDGEGGAAGSEE